MKTPEQVDSELLALKDQLDRGEITQEEFDEKEAELAFDLIGLRPDDKK